MQYGIGTMSTPAAVQVHSAPVALSRPASRRCTFRVPTRHHQQLSACRNAHIARTRRDFVRVSCAASVSAAQPSSKPLRFIQHKEEAFWFYRFLSIVYDHIGESIFHRLKVHGSCKDIYAFIRKFIDCSMFVASARNYFVLHSHR